MANKRRLVDSSKLLDSLRPETVKGCFLDWNKMTLQEKGAVVQLAEYFHEAVMTSPTVDEVVAVELDRSRDRRTSRPSKRGTWREGLLCAMGGVAVDSFFVCSECGGGVSCIFSRDKQFKFCPWCGVEMEEVTPENFLY